MLALHGNWVWPRRIRHWCLMIGRVDMLEVGEAVKHWKAQGLDLAPILMAARRLHDGVEVYCTKKQDHGLEKSLDNILIAKSAPALEKQVPVVIELPIKNIN